jgi:hypothetical protein
MSLLIPRDHPPVHIVDFNSELKVMSDFYSRVLVDFAFPAEEELGPNRKRRPSKLRGSPISKAVSDSIGLDKLPEVDDTALLSLRGRLSDLFADDDKSGADIIRELRESNE